LGRVTPNQHVFPFTPDVAFGWRLHGQFSTKFFYQFVAPENYAELDNFVVASAAASLTSKTVWCCIWFSEHTIINKTTKLFVKHFNCNMHDKDNRKIHKEKPPQAQQLISARVLDTTRQNNIIDDKTKQHKRQLVF